MAAIPHRKGSCIVQGEAWDRSFPQRPQEIFLHHPFISCLSCDSCFLQYWNIPSWRKFLESKVNIIKPSCSPWIWVDSLIPTLSEKAIKGYSPPNMRQSWIAKKAQTADAKKALRAAHMEGVETRLATQHVAFLPGCALSRFPAL